MGVIQDSYRITACEKITAKMAVPHLVEISNILLYNGLLQWISYWSKLTARTISGR